MHTLLQDARYGLRMLSKSPGVTAAAIVALALGIAATTVVFSAVNGVLLRPLPFPDAGRLVQVWSWDRSEGEDENSVSYPDFHDWRERNRSFERLAAYRIWLFNITGGDRPEAVVGAFVSADLFQLLGVEAALGRTFVAEEDRPGAARVAVISDDLWRRRFGADSAAMGRTITVAKEPHTIVGVMPPGFTWPLVIPTTAALSSRAADLWVPYAMDPAAALRGNHEHWTVGRLARGVTLPQARAEMAGIAKALEVEHPDDDADMGVNLIPLQDEIAGDVRPALLVLLCAVGMVLLTACANVANLLLARNANRQTEIAIRSAIGASAGRLARQLLTESVVLAGLGGVVGLLLAFVGIRVVIGLAPPDLPRVTEIGLDAGVLVFALAVTLLTGILFGLPPALQALRANLNATLKEGGTKTTGGRQHRRLGAALVVAEVAVALVLLIGAGLLIRSFVRLQNVDPGFDPENVLTTWILLPPEKYSETAQQAAFFRDLIERLQSLPGVRHAGVVNALPMSGTNSSSSFVVEGRPGPAPGQEPLAERRTVNEDYFRAMGIAILAGRPFGEADRETTLPVAVVNETMAQRFWPGEEAVGKRFSFDEDEKGERIWLEVVGVARDVRHYGLSEDVRPEAYQPFPQNPSFFGIVAVRTTSDPSRLAGAVARSVQAVDKDQPVFTTRTLADLVADSVAQQRFVMLLLMGFSAVALVLAAVGIYGAIAYSVSQRTREIGLRMALGAERGDVLRMVVRQGMALALIGLAIGLPAAFAGTRLLGSLLYGVSATDPRTFAGISALLTGVAMLASYLPARRAVRVDPVVAIKWE